VFQNRSNNSQFLVHSLKLWKLEIFPLNDFFKIQNKNIDQITKKMVYYIAYILWGYLILICDPKKGAYMHPWAWANLDPLDVASGKRIEIEFVI